MELYRTIAFQLFAAIHVVAVGGLAVTLINPKARRWFEERCVGRATAEDLAYVRAAVCLIAAACVLCEDLASCALLSEYWFTPPAILANTIGTDAFYALIGSRPALLVLHGSLILMLLLAAGGVAARFTVALSTAGYILFYGILGSFGKVSHVGLLALYALIALCFLPTGRRPGRSLSPSYYAWSVFAVYAAIVVPYLQLGLCKLIIGGPYWFEGAHLKNYMLTDDLNLWQFEIDLGLRFMNLPNVCFTIAAAFALLAELLYPLVLVVPRLRTVLPLCIVLLHIGIWLAQDALFLDAVLLPLIFLGPSRWRTWRKA